MRFLFGSNVGEFVILCSEWEGGMNRADGERMKSKERTQWMFCCTIFKFFIGLYLTRGISLMKLFFLLSLALCSRLPKCLSAFLAIHLYLSLHSSVLRVLPLPLCLSALFMSVHFCFIFDTPPPIPTVHPKGGLSHRGRYSERRFRLRVCGGNAAV